MSIPDPSKLSMRALKSDHNRIKLVDGEITYDRECYVMEYISSV
jgi:hypothetical protein